MRRKENRRRDENKEGEGEEVEGDKRGIRPNNEQKK